MKQGSLYLSFLLLLFVFTSCKTSFQPQRVDYFDYRIQRSHNVDSSLVRLMAPYADSVNKNMNQVIGNVAISLEKKQPEGTLNNLIADAVLEMAKQKFNTPVDAATINYGGIRLTQVPSGPLTRGKVFELLPFDNTVVLLEMPGDTLQRFLDLIAGRGGWPVSGIKMEIRDKMATNVMINGKSLDRSEVYTIATIDYIANGGDNANMLTSLRRNDVGYLLREAVIDYFSQLNKEGKSISAVLGGRTTIAE